MEKRIKAYKVVAWIATAILIAVQLFGWGTIVMASSGGESGRLSAAMIIYVVIPALLCAIPAVVFLILSSKAKLPRPGHIVAYTLTSLCALIFSLFVLFLGVPTGPEALYDLFIVLVFALIFVNLIFSIRGCNAAKYLRRQAQAQKLYQQQFMDYQPYPQYQQPNQQYLQYTQYQQPNQK